MRSKCSWLYTCGFSASPYLMNRITEAFRHQVEQIINPPEPGCAICHGAVLMGITSSSGIISRISRKTYGTDFVREFNSTIDPPDLREDYGSGEMCKETFAAFVHKGSEVKIDECVEQVRYPVFYGQRRMNIGVFSCSRDGVPKYVRDEGVVCEGRFTMDISDGMEFQMHRKIRLSMYFGRSAIEVRAQRVNFGGTPVWSKHFLC